MHKEKNTYIKFMKAGNARLAISKIPFGAGVSSESHPLVSLSCFIWRYIGRIMDFE